MKSRPWPWLIAGPNGAGKTTLARNKFGHLLNINADAEAERLSPDQPGRSALMAGKRTLAAMYAAIEGSEDFSVETTLAGRIHFRLIRRAKDRDWNIGLAYIGISDPDAALARVQERYRRGGHHVPPADVRRRYRRSLENLPRALATAGVGIVYDNTSQTGMERVLEVSEGQIVFLPERPPRWLSRCLRLTRLAEGERIVTPSA